MNIFIYCQSAAMGKGGMEKVAVELANYWSLTHTVYFSYLIKEDKTKPKYPVSQQVNLFPFESVKDNQNYKKNVLSVNPELIMLFGVGAHIIRLVGLFYKSKVPMILHEGSNPQRIIDNNWIKQRGISRPEALWERELIVSLTNRFRVTMDNYTYSLSPEIRYKSKGFPNAFKVRKWPRIQRKKRIINIGGLKENKNIYPLIMAFAETRHEFPDWELVIFSASNKSKQGQKYLNSIEDLIDKLNLDNVFLCGETDQIDLEYQQSSIHVITSLSEGLSGCVAESMCHGIPSIGYKNVPGVDGLINDGTNGLLADPNHPVESLVNVLVKLMSSEDLRIKLGHNALESSSIFDPNTNYKYWDQILIEAITEHKGKHDLNEVELHYQRVADDFFSKYFGNEFIKIRDIDDEIRNSTSVETIKENSYMGIKIFNKINKG